MKLSILFVDLLLPGKAVWADSASDRAAVERIVKVVLASAATDESISALFAADAESVLGSELGRLREMDRRLLGLSKEPLSEVTPPMVDIQSIRFVTSDVALVDAASTHYGSLVLHSRIPVLLVLRRDGADWRIVSLRVLVVRG